MTNSWRRCGDPWKAFASRSSKPCAPRNATTHYPSINSFVDVTAAADIIPPIPRCPLSATRILVTCFTSLRASRDPTRRAFAIDDLHSLDQILADVFDELEHAPSQPDHPWRLPVLGTTGSHGCELRTVVLRKFAPAQLALYCHTDLRSPKVAQLQQHPRTSWLFYHPGRRVQVRVTGITQLHQGDALANEFWNASAPASLNLYRALRAPGTIEAAPSSNLPPELAGRPLTREEVEPGRQLFVLIETTLQSIDWLRIDQSGSLRALFKWDAEGKRTANWVAP
ncbi:MAG: hypothetical protein CMJ46_01625 [Planctomyces sp.]|nr:hypothetical protein [Planctomyces sp.]